MREYLEYLKNPFIAGGVSGALIVLFAYLDKRMNDRDFDNAYFFKLFMGVFILVTALMYFVGSDNSGKTHRSQKGGGNIEAIVQKLDTTGHNNGLDVFTDSPDF